MQSVLEVVLEEEYDRSLRVTKLLEEEIASLPKGSIRERKINGRSYFYLTYRDGKTVKSTYIRKEDVDALREQIARRKKLVESLKVQRRSQKQIVRALGGVPHYEQ